MRNPTMKKQSLLLLLSLATVVGLVSCRSGAGNSNTSGSNQGDVSSSSTSSNVPKEFVDYAGNGTVRLSLDYTGHNFWTDGIEQVALYQTIDGDTAHFTTKQKNSKGDTILKSRFYGIDTPESTGKVQPWGKPASKYTSEILEKANKNGTIVVSSPQSVYAAPSPDSTGSRYVSLIWVNETVKNAPLASLKLLNLMIVQDGYSWVKNVSDIPEYVDTFYAAENQAKERGLNLFGTDPDPMFNYGGYRNVSLLEIKNETVASLKDSNHKNAFDNEKVTVQGAVAGFSNHILYIQDYCSYVNDSGEPLYFNDKGESIYQDKIDAGIMGEYAGINIFTGMSAIPSKFTKVGAYIQVSALALESDFGFQLTDAKFPTISYDESDAQVLIKAENNTGEHALKTFEYTASELNALITNQNFEAFNCSVKVTDPVTVTGGYNSDSATILYTSNDKNAFSVYFTFQYQPDPDDQIMKWTSYEKFVGHSFLFSGVFGIHTNAKGTSKFNLYPSKSADMVWQDKA